MASRQWAIIVIAMIIVGIDAYKDNGVKPGLLLAALAYTLLGALLPELFIPFGLVVITYLLVANPNLINQVLSIRAGQPGKYVGGN